MTYLYENANEFAVISREYNRVYRFHREWVTQDYIELNGYKVEILYVYSKYEDPLRCLMSLITQLGERENCEKGLHVKIIQIVKIMKQHVMRDMSALNDEIKTCNKKINVTNFKKNKLLNKKQLRLYREMRMGHFYELGIVYRFMDDIAAYSTRIEEANKTLHERTRLPEDVIKDILVLV